MSKQLAFNELKKSHLEKLKLYVPVVSRVHGDSHPEFYEVQKQYDIIANKINQEQNPMLNEEFTKLREITNNYQVPSGVCESYEAVYNMLAELDRAYNAL